MKKSLKMPIILGSTSPRRIELMKHAGISVQVASPHADETPKRGENPRDLVRRLSLAKAQSLIAPTLKNHKCAIIISADTIVVSPDRKKILGKPIHPMDAKKMLRLLSGRTHTVLTSYTILQVSRSTRTITRNKTVSSQVKLATLTPRTIDAYVQTGEPMDKAGSYAAQGQGMVFVESIKGSYSNVVGLPMVELLRDLANHFGIQPFEVI